MERTEYLTCVYASDGNSVFTFKSEYERFTFIVASLEFDPKLKYSTAEATFKFPTEEGES